MAHEILSVKLCQLDDRLGRLHTRIHMSETANHDRLQQEITSLEQQCTEVDEMLKKSLYHSKARIASVLAQNYGQIEKTIQETDAQLHTMETNCQGDESYVEEKILLPVRLKTKYRLPESKKMNTRMHGIAERYFLHFSR